MWVILGLMVRIPWLSVVTLTNLVRILVRRLRVPIRLIIRMRLIIVCLCLLCLKRRVRLRLKRL